MRRTAYRAMRLSSTTFSPIRSINSVRQPCPATVSTNMSRRLFAPVRKKVQHVVDLLARRYAETQDVGRHYSIVITPMSTSDSRESCSRSVIWCVVWSRRSKLAQRRAQRALPASGRTLYLYAAFAHRARWAPSSATPDRSLVDNDTLRRGACGSQGDDAVDFDDLFHPGCEQPRVTVPNATSSVGPWPTSPLV